MDPNEERLSAMPIQPCGSMRHNFISTPLEGVIAILSRTPAAKTGIVRTKSAVKSVTSAARIQDHGTHKCRRRVAMLTHDHGKVKKVLGQRYFRPGYFVELRIRPGQYGGVRRGG